ncbi:MFS general substrate transporter [Thermothelomyces heterothallicus CBS 203.75]
MASSSRARSVDLIDADTERTALLAATPTQSPGYRTSKSISQAIPNNDDIDDGDNDAAASAAVNHLRALLRPRVVVLSIVLIFFIELGIGMGIPPTNAVMESIICRQMHPGILPPPGEHHRKTRRFAGGVILVDDPTCKHPDVQGYLAMLRGWQNTFECFPGLVGAVPYGILSDRWGRRPVLGLGLAGIGASVAFTYIIFYFSDVVPLWTTWFSAAFQLIGGGGSIVVAMLYTAVADVVPPAERTTVFFQMAAVFLASQMIAGPLGGTMLLWDPWIPLLVSLLVLVLTALSVLVYPETVHLHDGKGSREESHRVGDDIPPVTKLVHKVREGFVDMRAFVLGNASVVFLLLSFVFVVLGRYVGEILLQYSTDRYGWSWSTASMVLTIRNAGSLVTLLAAMPVASWFCTQHLGMESVAKDLWLTRWSGIFHVVGSFTIAAAANGIVYSFGLAWFALGSGMVATTRSLLNALVEEHHVGTLNSLIALMETVGLSVSGPLLAGSLRVGLDLGGAWIGLPFFTAGVFFVVSTAIVWFFRLPDSRSPSTTAEPSC